jgi:small subunit ribosomal protein S20
MPITKSAKKALRASDRRRVLNDARKDAVRGTAKALKKLVVAGKLDEARKALGLAYKAVDKAAKRGLLKKNTASRKKSQLARLLKKDA